MKYLFACLLWGMTTMITYSQSLEQVIGKKTDGSDLKQPVIVSRNGCKLFLPIKI